MRADREQGIGLPWIRDPQVRIHGRRARSRRAGDMRCPVAGSPSGRWRQWASDVSPARPSRTRKV